MELTIPLGFSRKIGIFNAFELSRKLRNLRIQHWSWSCGVVLAVCCTLANLLFQLNNLSYKSRVHNRKWSLSLEFLCWANRLLSEVKVAINQVLYCITKLATVQGENHRDVLYLSTVSERPFCTSLLHSFLFLIWGKDTRGFFYASVQHELTHYVTLMGDVSLNFRVLTVRNSSWTKML